MNLRLVGKTTYRYLAPILTTLITLAFLILPALTNIPAVHAHDCGPVAITMNVGETYHLADYGRSDRGRNPLYTFIHR